MNGATTPTVMSPSPAGHANKSEHPPRLEYRLTRRGQDPRSGAQVCLSIVGTDRTPDNGYFRAKVAQENLIKASVSLTPSSVRLSFSSSGVASRLPVRTATW